MVVDERFGSLLVGSQGNAMGDSGGQGFGGVFAGCVSVEERTAGGGGGNQGLRLTKNAWRMRKRNLAAAMAREVDGSSGMPDGH